MRFQFSNLWRWEGTTDRGTYALVGVVGFALKHNLDRLLATVVFHRHWDVFNYWIPLGQAVRFTSLPPQGARFLAAMVALALPFIWAGVVLTLRRLRDAGLPLWLVAFFFLPFLNLLFFALLTLVPSRGEVSEARLRVGRPMTLLGRLIPVSAVGSALTAIVITVTLGLAMALLGTAVLETYGWGLFVALPFCLGLFSVLLYGYHHPRSYSRCTTVACISVGMVAAGLAAFAVEGFICLIMAAPLGLLLGMLGGSVGYLIQRRPGAGMEAPAMLSVVLLFVPALVGLERVAAPEPPVFAVRTAIEIDAPPGAVWREVVAFAQIPEPREWLFRLGIAYPVRAEIRGRGPGAERHCVFSTGAFVEPIEVWDESRRLKFGVTSNPPPMQEWTPYSKVEPPHLRGFLVSSGGQFLLTPLPRGRTRLEGTTWYRHTMWPAGYWRLWSDYIIRQIHLRVLRHIARLTALGPREAGAELAPP